MMCVGVAHLTRWGRRTHPDNIFIIFLYVWVVFEKKEKKKKNFRQQPRLISQDTFFAPRHEPIIFLSTTAT